MHLIVLSFSIIHGLSATASESFFEFYNYSGRTFADAKKAKMSFRPEVTFFLRKGDKPAEQSR